MSPITEEILRKAQAYGLKITCAESCTGGMISAALTDIAGSSAIFEQGFVTYSNAAKQKMLGVRPETLADYGAVSEPVAREMAEGALRQAQADIAISVSGIAGPGGSEFKPEGRVCFALASAQGTQSETQDFGALGRAAVRQAALNHALNLIHVHLNLAH
ncbi:CinA family protein [Planktomarina temperata]|jgi:nicotinamide-nucleotide amidase|uniref:CinA family protein n=1 Tax=Planktomarina temperata TaxID=1284658 RepID=UPI0023B638BE